MALIERFTPGGNLYPDGSSTFAMLGAFFQRLAENRDTLDRTITTSAASEAVEIVAPNTMRQLENPDVVFAVTDEDDRRTWIEAGPDGGPTDYSAGKFAPIVAPAAAEAAGLSDQDTDISGLSFAVVDEDNRRTWIEADKEGRPTQRALELIGAVGGSLDRESLASGPDGAVIGSSSAAGAGGNGTTIHGELANLTGRTWRSLGVGGEQSPTIAGRFGGRPWLATVDGATIPASGSVVVTLEADDGSSVSPGLQGWAGVNPVDLGGVRGTLSLSGGVYSFTRETAGDVVPTPRRLPVITDASRNRAGDILIFWLGLNDPDTAEADEDIIGRTNAMIEHLTALDKRYLVAGRWAYSPNPRNEDRLLREYGRRYVNVRDYLVRYGLADNGITPTAEDETDMAAGRVPASLKYDSAHMNAAGYTAAAAEFNRRLTEMGWI